MNKFLFKLELIKSYKNIENYRKNKRNIEKIYKV